MLICTSKIDQNEFSVLDFLVILFVMQCRRSYASRNNTWKCMFPHTLFAQRKIKRSLHLTFVHTRFYIPHQFFDRLLCCMLCNHHFFNFNIFFFDTLSYKLCVDISDFHCRILFLNACCQKMCLCRSLGHFIFPQIQRNCEFFAASG